MKDAISRILLVEDDKVDQTAFLRMVKVQDLTYLLTVADSLLQAREALEQNIFDVVIADYLLGDGTALDILELAKDVPVIIVTGAGDEEVAVKAWKAGAYDYLIKDAHRNYLKAVPITVQNAIDHRRAEERLRLLSHAICGTDDRVYITGLDNKIMFVNRSFCETYGYAEDEVIGRDLSVLWGGASNEKCDRSCRIVSGWETGFYHRRKNGQEFPVSVHQSIIKDEKGREIAYLGVAREISEDIFVEDKLRAIDLELKQDNRRTSSLQ